MVIIALTMYGLGWFFDGLLKSDVAGITSLNFFLLVFSTTLVAAAGNIINDYFDRKADRINKPEKLIIGKFVKRRVAIVTHVLINLLALSIAGYLSWELASFGFVLIHLLTINLLWFYSMYFKRKFLIGNVIIAGLTAMVPLLVGFYYDQCISSGALEVSNFNDGLLFISAKILIIVISIGLAGFAFIINLGREIIKDMEDIPGDKILKARTIPIVLGIKSSKWIVTLILLAALLFITLVIFLLPKIELIGLLSLFVAGILVLVAIITNLIGETKQHYKLANNWLKLAMIAGVLTPIIWRVLFYYGT